MYLVATFANETFETNNQLTFHKYNEHKESAQVYNGQGKKENTKM